MTNPCVNTPVTVLPKNHVASESFVILGTFRRCLWPVSMFSEHVGRNLYRKLGKSYRGRYGFGQQHDRWHRRSKARQLDWPIRLKSCSY